MQQRGRPKVLADRKMIQVNIERAHYDILSEEAYQKRISFSAHIRAILENHVRTRP